MMSVSGIFSNVSLITPNFINRTAIQGPKNQQSTLGQARPQQLEQFQDQTDVVNLSSKALQLSKNALFQSPFKK